MAFKRRAELGRCRAKLFPIALVRDRGENAARSTTRAMRTSTVATSDAEARMSNAGVIIAAIIATRPTTRLRSPFDVPSTGERKNSQSAGSVSIGPRLGPGRTSG